MTAAEVKKIAQEEYDRLNPTYNTLDEVPNYWRDDIKAMMDKGIIAGIGGGKLGLTKSETKGAVIVWRAVNEMK